MPPHPERPPLGLQLPNFFPGAIQLHDAAAFGAGDERVAIGQARTPGGRLYFAFPVDAAGGVHFGNTVDAVPSHQEVTVREKFNAGPGREALNGEAVNLLAAW